MRRRDFLIASGAGFGGLSFAPALSQATDTNIPSEATAKATILFFLSGGASHVDMWDMKPQAPKKYRGPFQPIATSVPGVQLCEHLPLLARQAHHLALVNSVGATVNTNDHHAGYYHNLTGHIPDQTFRTQGNDRKPYPDDWPFMGTVVGSRRPQHPYLTNTITLPSKPGAPRYTRPGQFAARLGVEHEPLYVLGEPDKPLQFQAPSLTLSGEVNARRMTQRHLLVRSIDAARQQFDRSGQVETWHRQQERAMSLLTSSRTAQAFDLSQEPESVQQRYGKGINGMGLLLARRLVEAQVPFISVFWKGDPEAAKKLKCASGGGWDTHGNNFECLAKHLLPQFDRAYSALIEDLAERGLLSETLVLITSEMGRKPKIGDPRSGGVSGAGRDHWTHCLTDVLAGGGIRGGQTYGTTDRFGEYPADKPVTPADITKTVYHAMGIHDLTAYDSQNRPYQLLERGEPIHALL